MTTDPMSIQYSQNVPAPAPGYLRPAERFASFADYAAWTTSLPQPAATSLDVARFHAFTGELTFSIDPAVRLYLDGGSVYHAERDGGPPLSRVLLDAGVVNPVQLRRGIVSVGDVEHLGRLFEREPTIDRDVVMVVVEQATEELVQQVANSVIATVTGLAYRHHPSGIHRWFVAPIERFAVHRPSSGVMQVHRSVVEEMPQPVPAPVRSEQPAEDSDPDPDSDRDPDCDGDPESVDDALHIEWAEPDLSNPGRSEAADDLEPPTLDDTDLDTDLEIDTDLVIEADIEAELDSFDADRADWAIAPRGNDPVASQAAPTSMGEFRLVWPDGTRDESIITADGVPVEQPVSTEAPVSPEAAQHDDGPTVFDPPDDHASIPVETPPRPESAALSPTPSVIDSNPLSARDGHREPNDHRDPTDHRDLNDHRDSNHQRDSNHHRELRDLPAPSATEGVGVRIEPVQLDWIPEPDAAVPDDVASVVRRALRALESAGSRPVHPDTADSPVVPTPAPAAPSRVEPVGFAPPSIDTRVDAVPERTQAEDDFWALTEGIGDDARASLHELNDASTDFGDGADDPDGDDKSERRSALRRLIGSLRGKD